MSATAQASEFLEKLDHTHIVLFHEDDEKSKSIEFDFIKQGLDNKEHCFYTTQNPQKILDGMKNHGIDTEKNRDLLHIVQIPPKFENYSKMILDKVSTLPQDSKIRLISTHYFDFNSEEKTDRMAEIEQCVDDDYEKIKGNMICSFAVNHIDKKLRDRFLNQLLDSHNAIMFQTKENGTEVFMLP